MKEESTSRKVVRNTLFNYLSYFVIAALRIVSMPIIISGLGNERYGIYAAVMGVLGYVGLLDLGIGISLTKFVAEYHARKEYQRLNDIFSTALILYIGLGVLGAGILIGFSEIFVVHIFHIQEAMWEEARYVFWITAVSLFNGLTFGVFGNLLYGIQRQDISRTISMFNVLLSCVGSIIIVKLGYKLVPFVLYIVSVALLTFLVQMIIAKRYLPMVKFFPRIFKRREVKKIVNFSFAMFINQIAARNMSVLEKTILGIFLPIANVTLYTIANTLALFCFKLPAAAVLATLPAASELTAQNRHDAVRELVLRSMKYTGLLAIPTFVPAAIMAQDIVRIWMGEEYYVSARILQLLIPGYFFLAMASSGMSIMVGIGRPYVNTFYALAQIFLCSTLMIFMMRAYGVLGAAAGSGFAYSLGGITYVIHSTIIFKIPFSRIINGGVVGKVFLLNLPGIAWAAFAHRYSDLGIISTLTELFFYGITYWFLAIRYVIDDYDMEKSGGVMPRKKRLDVIRR